MVQIPIVSGIYADSTPDFRTAYPVNLEPIPKITGISEGYLRAAEGFVQTGVGPGIDRGGINWNGQCYRVMGRTFVAISDAGVVTEIGTVGGSGPVSMSYGFTYLAIASGGRLYLYDGATLAQVTDPDLGVALDVQWIDGYFMTTDGENLVVTELGDPFSVNPLKYGSSEVDPDRVVAVVRLNNEVYAVNRHTIEAFANVGGALFPFAVIDGTQIYRGAVGTHACCVFMGGIAFVGSGVNEEIAVHIMAGGGAAKISTREIDDILSDYPEDILAKTVCETRYFDGREVFYIHLPDRTICYDGPSSQAIGQPVWFFLSTSADGNGQYRARHFVRCYNTWIVGDTKSPRFGIMSETDSAHWGEVVGWEFHTPIVYNEGRGAVEHEVQLSCLTGATSIGQDAAIGESHSDDGVTWSQYRAINAGAAGARGQPIKWQRLGMFRNRRIHRFQGDSNSRIAVARIDATLEPLKW